MSANRLRGGLNDLSKVFTSSGSAKVPESILDFARLNESNDDLQHVAPFFYQLWKRLLRAPGSLNTDALHAVARQAGSSDGISVHLRTAVDYLFLWTEIDRYFERCQLRQANSSEIAATPSHASAIREELRSHQSQLSTSYGLLMLEAMLASLHDRDAAAELFRAAKAENPDFAAAHLLDESISTYFTEGEIRAKSSEIAKRRARFMSDFELLEGGLPGGEDSTLLLFSCDPVFFAAFFPYWASLAEYLRDKDIYLHFLLVSDRSEAETAVERAVALAAGIAGLRGGSPLGPPSPLSFSTVPAPSEVANPKTFYSCARYLAAAKILANSGGRVLILDIDMMMRDDPSKSLRALREVRDLRLPVVMTSGPVALVPARRYLAGRVVVPHGEPGEQAISDIENYIYAGLFGSNSWTLDQNALTYAADRAIAAHGRGSITDVNRYISPFGQAPIRLLYREGQLKRS